MLTPVLSVVPFRHYQKVSTFRLLSGSHRDSGFLRTQGCHRPDETSPLSEDAYTRSHCYDSILVMKGQVLVKPTSEILLADKMVPAVRGEVRFIKMLLLGKVM